ncbi:PQQ-dependent sugar dehydrogenase [Halotalea alkalilenta]|uniref:Sorbosone dehydrogenase n=1 Tax=Halotalea alkalilenta TaxID=376489 RepID=A0A172YFE6_9GAMM|nr:sorbosone dehydrogenase family protein [Halotalea alkalilenta]ANF57989.1 sorbosone dehydrogenase [Halotalea alkalilenta]
MRRIMLLLVLPLAACGDTARHTVEEGSGPNPVLPEERREWFPTLNVAEAIGWPDGALPAAAEGLAVNAYAQGLDHPRWLYLLPNGDVLVAESNAPADSGVSSLKNWVAGLFKSKAGAGAESADRITLLRDGDGDGVAEQRHVLLDELHSPFGMALVGEWLYVANADALVRVPYREGDTRIDSTPEVVTELPSEINHHWTKNVIASPDGEHLYVTVGSNSNVGENGLDQEEGRAAIWEVDIASGDKRLFATGLRNPNGMDWEPESGALWTVVNERDELGSDLVPDYATEVVDGAFYGWPYSYFGQHVDARVSPQQPELVATARVPDYALGPHTASLGLAFARNPALPERFQQGMFIGQHGSWNRKPHSGYRVVFIPFAEGRPAGDPVEVLGGFLDDQDRAQGRPVGVIQGADRSLLVADDVGNAIWRVSQAQ